MKPEEEDRMMKVESSAVIDRPVEEVWRFISDLDNAPKWELYDEGKQTSEGPVVRGTRVSFGGKFMGKRLDYEGQMWEWEPNKGFTFGSDRFVFKKPAYLRFTLDSVEEGGKSKTRMTTVYAMTVPGLWNLIKPILVWGVKRERLEANVKRILESEPSTA
jgi:uncharacterized protein YndB with AHSA1/START domain